MLFKPKPTHTVYMSDTDKTLVLHTSPWASVRFVLPNLCWIFAAVVSAGLIYSEFAHHPFEEETRKYWLGLFVFAWSVTFGCAALLKTCVLLYAWPRFYTQIQLSPQGLRLQDWQHKQHFIAWKDIQAIQDIYPHQKLPARYAQLTVAPEHYHRLQRESHIDKPYFTQETQNLFILLPTWQWQAKDVSRAIHTYWAMHVEGFPYVATKTSQQQTENTSTNE